MAHIFRNPNLPDYFMSADFVTLAGADRSYLPEYEAAKVIALPKIKLDIDHKFWAAFDRPEVPEFKKLNYLVSADQADVGPATQRLSIAQLDPDLEREAARQMTSIVDALIPVYRSLFNGYTFLQERVVWRLHTIMAENLHVDTYKTPLPDHFARMFINLDDQPRIWHTSWTIDDIMKMQDGRVSREILESGDLNKIWATMNQQTFGKNSKEWWDNQPRHIAYFEPGDVWVVDSRQVSHQIYYGRRAVSIDFTVDSQSMLNPSRQYLALAEDFRSSQLAHI